MTSLFANFLIFHKSSKCVLKETLTKESEFVCLSPQFLSNFCFFITSLILSDCSDEFRRIILMKLLTKDIFDGQYEWLSKGFLPFCGLHGSIIIIFILIPDSEPPFCSRHYKLQRKKPFGFSGPPSFRYVRQLACRHLGQVVKKLLLWWSLLCQ